VREIGAFEIGVAGDAVELAVDRPQEDRQVNAERDLNAVAFRREVEISVAGHAVVDLLGRNGCRE